MPENKTQPTTASVKAFLAAIPDETSRKDCLALQKLMERATGAKGKLWGPSIVGFGDYHYKYASGREGDWFPAGFSPRKQDLTLYLMGGLRPALLRKLGKHKIGKSCLYIKKLADIDLEVLTELVAGSLEDLQSIIATRKAEGDK
ncbi:MAG: DUF1801 domain-containing protein [Acidobacteriota bacterium]